MPPAAAGISSSGGTLTAPLEDSVMPSRAGSGGFSRPVHSPGAITTPSGAGRTRVLLPDEPSTLTAGAVEHYKTVPRARSAGSKVAIALASVGAVALVAVVIVRVLTGQPAGGEARTPTAQADPTGGNATQTTSTGSGTGTTPGETERAQPPHAQPPPPPAISVITLLGLPPQALVRLDGHAVTPPVSVPREAETHQLIVDASGYQRWETSFDASKDHTVAVEMKPLAATPSRAPDHAAPAQARRRRQDSARPAGL